MTHPMLTWYLAQLDADEAEAKQAGPRHADDTELYVQDDDAYYPLVIGPKFVLADIAAKRAILELHSADDPIAGSCKVCEGDAWSGRAWWPCNTVRLLVSTCASRPGYDPDWAPS